MGLSAALSSELFYASYYIGVMPPSQGDRTSLFAVFLKFKFILQVPARPSHWPMMTLLSTVGEEPSIQTEEDPDPLPDNLKQIWAKVNKTMQPVNRQSVYCWQ